MTPSVPRRLLGATLAAFAILAAAPTVFAVNVQSINDPVTEARAALAAGDFSAMKSALDPHLSGAPLDDPSYDDARVLRAVARLGLVATDGFPGFVRRKLGANVAILDTATGDLAIRFPRPAYYLTRQGSHPIPGFTTAGPAFFQHNPALNLYLNGGAQPSIAFENTGPAIHPITFTLSQPEGAEPLYEAALYLDGQLLGFALATPGYPTEVFVLPVFNSLAPHIPDPFDLDASTPANFLIPGSQPGSFTVKLPPKSNLTIGLVVSGGNLRFTPSAPLPASIVTRNARAGAITPPRIADTANFSDLVGFAANADSATLSPAVADLSAVSPGVSLVLSPEETGSARDTVIAYPDVQLLLAELKFLQAIRRLTTSYNFGLPIKPSFFNSEFSRLIARHPALLTPLPPTAARAADRRTARTLLEEACDHYTTASDSGLFTREVPSSGTYLFSLAEEAPEAATDIKDATDGSVGLFRTLLSESVPVEDEGDATVSLSPLFGSPAVNVRGIIPLATDDGFVSGSSTRFLASGFFRHFGTAAWEELLAKNDLLDLTVPPVTGPAKIQRQPAALTQVSEGDPASLSVVAESFPAPAYQWFRRLPDNSKSPIAGATRSVLKFEEASRTDSGRYFVEVTNERIVPPKITPTRVTVTSTTAVLRVTYAPEIATPPVGAVRYETKNVTLTVGAIGEPKPRSFQWFKDGAPITGERATPTYTFVASPARAGAYRVVVKNSEGEITSAPVTVEVQTKPIFTTHPSAQSVAVNGSATFTAVATGNPAPQIKWRKDGKDLSDATGPTLTIDQASLADRGVYTAVAFSTVQTGPSATAVVSTVSTGARLTVSNLVVSPDSAGVFRDQVPPNNSP
jgi:hypothetical protein